jgi:hypothetical protein
MDFGRITITDDIVQYLFATRCQGAHLFRCERSREGMLVRVMVDATDAESL